MKTSSVKSKLEERPEWIGIVDNLDEYQGFVYRITNKLTGEFYIGKKNLWTIKKLRPLKGKKNKRHVKTETDWKTYWGSCNTLKEDIRIFGKFNFKREIIKYCVSKFDLNYSEMEIQVKDGLLFNDDCYNELIRVRLRKRGKVKIR